MKPEPAAQVLVSNLKKNPLISACKSAARCCFLGPTWYEVGSSTTSPAHQLLPPCPWRTRGVCDWQEEVLPSSECLPHCYSILSFSERRPSASAIFHWSDDGLHLNNSSDNNTPIHAGSWRPLLLLHLYFTRFYELVRTKRVSGKLWMILLFQSRVVAAFHLQGDECATVSKPPCANAASAASAPPSAHWNLLCSHGHMDLTFHPERGRCDVIGRRSSPVFCTLVATFKKRKNRRCFISDLGPLAFAAGKVSLQSPPPALRQPLHLRRSQAGVKSAICLTLHSKLLDEPPGQQLIFSGKKERPDKTQSSRGCEGALILLLSVVFKRQRPNKV